MKLPENKFKHNRIMAKYLAGEMTTSEKASFEKLILDRPENELLLKKMTDYWNRMELPENTPEFDADRAWNSLYMKMQKTTPDAKEYKWTRPRMQWYARAVALLLLIALSSTLVFTDVLYKKDIVLAYGTDDPTTLVYHLGDGSVAYLSGGTTIKFSKKFGKKDRYISLQGEAFFDVMPNPLKPFVVETNNAIVRVLGTSFSLKSTHRNNFELLVETGTVSVASKSKKEDVLIAEAGDKVRLVDNNLTKSTTAVKPHQRWSNKRLQFKDESVFNIVRVINKCYNANIIVESSAVGEKRITVTFDNNDISAIVKVISATLNLEPKYINNTILLTSPADGQ